MFVNAGHAHVDDGEFLHEGNTNIIPINGIVVEIIIP